MSGLSPPVPSRDRSQSSKSSASSVRRSTIEISPILGSSAVVKPPENPGISASKTTTSTHEDVAVSKGDGGGGSGDGSGDTIRGVSEGLTYFKYVEYVAPDSAILSEEFKNCRQSEKVDVIVLDIQEDGTCSAPKIFGESDSISNYLKSTPSGTSLAGQDSTALREFLEKPKPDEVIVRLVFVEDLSPIMVETLGSALDLDPNLFSMHLAGARYKHYQEDSYSNNSFPKGDLVESIHQKLSGRAFDNAKLKNHFSWVWRRRVWVDPGISYWPNFRRNLYRSFTLLEPLKGNTDSRDTVVYKLGMVEERISFLGKNDQGSGWTGIFLFDGVRDYASVKGYSEFGNSILYEYHRLNIHSSPSYKQLAASNHTHKEYHTDPSTRNLFVTYITSMNTGGSCACGNSMSVKDIPSLVLHPILHFILHDWRGVGREVEEFLDKIDSHLWRGGQPQGQIALVPIFGDLRKDLFEDGERILAMLKAIGKENLGNFGTDFENVLSRIESLKDRMEKTANSLVSTMSILESKRAISEAESVSRLTELAFFFIPLSFATSLFGMQIPGWSENYKPYMWPVISVSLVLGAYIFRYIIHRVRSDFLEAKTTRSWRPGPYIIWLQHIERKWAEKVSDASQDGPVPKRLFLSWFIVWYWVDILTMWLSAIVLVFVWILIHSIPVRVGVTILIFLFLVVGVYLRGVRYMLDKLEVIFL